MSLGCLDVGVVCLCGVVDFGVVGYLDFVILKFWDLVVFGCEDVVMLDCLVSGFLDFGIL